MSNNWIKMRDDLQEDPAVIWMADQLDVREEVVVGYCHKFWSWVSRQCHDGSVTGVTLASLGRIISLPGFPELLRDVGWLEYDDTSPRPGGKPVLRIPNFERHLSQGAKQRALASERQRAKRVTQVSRSQRDKIVTREEKRRVKNNSVITDQNGGAPKKPRDPPYSATFEAFWSAFPKLRRRDKARAAEAWQNAVATMMAENPETGGREHFEAFLVKRATDYARSPLGRSEFAKMPGSWLNARAWEDSPESWQHTSEQQKTPKNAPARFR